MCFVMYLSAGSMFYLYVVTSFSIYFMHVGDAGASALAAALDRGALQGPHVDGKEDCRMHARADVGGSPRREGVVLTRTGYYLGRVDAASSGVFIYRHVRAELPRTCAPQARCCGRIRIFARVNPFRK